MTGERHDFQAAKVFEEECDFCGRDEDDEIHTGPATPINVSRLRQILRDTPNASIVMVLEDYDIVPKGTWQER